MTVYVEEETLIAIVRDYARRRGSPIDTQTAQHLLNRLGSAYPLRRETAMIVHQCSGTTALFTSEELRQALRPYLQRLAEQLKQIHSLRRVQLDGYPLRGLALLLREELQVPVE